MFESYSEKLQKQAKKDYARCKACYDDMKACGADNASIKVRIDTLLSGAEWAEEIINALFYSYKNHQRREYKQYRYEYKQDNERQSMSDIVDALHFFGFVSLPDVSLLKKRYRELALKLHPDKGGNTGIFQKFQNYKDCLYAQAGIE